MLTFPALNAVGAAKQFQRSANFVAVTLAGIYGARQHFCVLGDMRVADRQEYDRTVRDVDGIFFGDWLKREFDYQPGMVGDLAYIPLDADGRACPCPEPMAEGLEEVFRPRPTYEELLDRPAGGGSSSSCAPSPGSPSRERFWGGASCTCACWGPAWRRS